MQQSALQIRDKLLSGLDNDYNVVNMEIVVDVLSQLENFQITKEALETTRLGKHINELRRKTSDRHLASRAKSLVKTWRQLVVSASSSSANSAINNGSNGNNNDQSKPQQGPPVPVTNNGSLRRVSPPVIPSGASTSVATTAQSIASNNRNHHKSHNNRTSSLPSSASTSPGISQPTTPSSSRPVSPYNGVTGVSKTNAANKRLRKEMAEQNENEEPPAKRPNNTTTNGFNSNNLNADFLMDGDTRDSVLSSYSNTNCDNNTLQYTQNLKNQSQTPAAITPARRKTRSSTNKSKEPDMLEQQMLSVRKAAGKVRTTQEIVQELALRSHSPGGFVNKNNAVTDRSDQEGYEINETKVELMNRFFESQDNLPATANGLSPPLSRAPSPSEQQLASAVSSRPSSPRCSTSRDPSRSVTPFTGGPAEKVNNEKESVDDIMSKLPLIKASEELAKYDFNQVEEDDDEEDIAGLIPVKPRELPEVTEEMIDKLHNSNYDNFNGNFDHKGEFKEWHEVLTKETKDGELLYVLPYSIID